MAKHKQFHFSAGDSSKGSIGFCAVIRAKSKDDAVALLKRVLPDSIKVHPAGDDKDNAAVEYIEVYINAKAVTVKDIDEEEEVDGE